MNLLKLKTKKHSYPLWKRHLYSIFVSLLLMALAISASFSYHYLVPDNIANISLFFILALILIGRYTVGYLYSTVFSLVSVIIINWIFTYPYFKINFTLSGYPLTFLVMLTISLMISNMTAHLTLQAEMITQRERELAEAEMEKMRANLLRAISHDLRTPLTGIIGNSSLFLTKQEALSISEQREILSHIHNDSLWLLNMVENLLTITRIHGDNFVITTREESVEEVLSEALQKLHKRYPQAEIKIHFPEDFIMLPMDAILIEQVTINLLENAIVHAGSKKPIEVLVENNQSEVAFIIRDHGTGIAPDLLPRIFDGVVYTKSKTPDSRKGMGIGLSICKTIITAHHGTILARNHSEGAEFIFTLPKQL